MKLSDAVQALPKQVTAFVHGVPHAFIKVGEAKSKAAKDGQQGFDQGAYFIGKVGVLLFSLNAKILCWHVATIQA